ncbi:MAG TPA: hypothetical protein VFZ73_12860, partial [Gemmatimonadaceae bacterium]
GAVMPATDNANRTGTLMMENRVRSQLVRRAVTLMLRGGLKAEGNVHVGERQSLIVYLATRGFFLNLTEVHTNGTDEVFEHLAVRTDMVLWAQTHDRELPLTEHSAPSFEPRWAEIVMEGGTTLQAGLHLASDQRMTDCIDARTGFLPAVAAAIVESRELLGPIAINMNRAISVREIAAP